MIRLMVCVSAAAIAASSAAADLPAGEEHVNSLGMKLVRIEPGSFQMGTAEGGDFDERPVHKVTISRPFFLGATEVTNAQYEQFDPAHAKLRGKLGYSKDDGEAVVFVSWLDGSRFCQWLSRKEGRHYRLPTEAEWEYACRAGTTGDHWTGDKLPVEFQKNPRESWFPSDRAKTEEVCRLDVGRTPPDPARLSPLGEPLGHVAGGQELADRLSRGAG